MINYCIIKNHATKYEWYHSTMTRLKMLYKVYVSFIFVKILFSCCFFFLGKNFWERDCATLLKTKFLKYKIYFSRILTENFPWQLSKQLLIRTFFFQEHLCGCFWTLITSTRQLDYSLYCVFSFPHLLFCRVYPGHQVQHS